VTRVARATKARASSAASGSRFVAVRREERLRRALEGGCAFRVLQAATRLRERGHGAADEAYRVARELAPYELLPSPTWEVMCSELEWPV
jgi:hypothetical protein